MIRGIWQVLFDVFHFYFCNGVHYYFDIGGVVVYLFVSLFLLFLLLVSIGIVFPVLPGISSNFGEDLVKYSRV